MGQARRPQRNVELVSGVADAFMAGDLDAFARGSVEMHRLIDKPLGDEINPRRSEASRHDRVRCETCGGVFAAQMYARWHKGGRCLRRPVME